MNDFNASFFRFRFFIFIYILGENVYVCTEFGTNMMLLDVHLKPMKIEARNNTRTESPKIRNRRMRKKVLNFFHYISL